MDSNYTINSKEYWDKRFATGDWEKSGGNNQTLYFYELLYALLPKHIKKVFLFFPKDYSSGERARMHRLSHIQQEGH